jgi:hypothetical protein
MLATTSPIVPTHLFEVDACMTTRRTHFIGTGVGLLHRSYPANSSHPDLVNGRCRRG